MACRRGPLPNGIGVVCRDAAPSRGNEAVVGSGMGREFISLSRLAGAAGSSREDLVQRAMMRSRRKMAENLWVLKGSWGSWDAGVGQ